MSQIDQESTFCTESKSHWHTICGSRKFFLKKLKVRKFEKEINVSFFSLPLHSLLMLIIQQFWSMHSPQPQVFKYPPPSAPAILPLWNSTISAGTDLQFCLSEEGWGHYSSTELLLCTELLACACLFSANTGSSFQRTNDHPHWAASCPQLQMKMDHCPGLQYRAW